MLDMVRQLRILWKLQPIIKKLKEQSTMKLSVNALIQILGTVTSGITMMTDMLPGKAKFWAVVAVSAIQGIAGVLSHFSNPDGTPAAEAYVK